MKTIKNDEKKRKRKRNVVNIFNDDETKSDMIKY